ncbi:MAG: hemolytic protein HlpA [Candidatus Marinimicrobia bacterium]|nr:hemolytic protein HlpA [Candidatus Neomarinimicrobiota bacterium]|tara:strand:- start:14788 stop:15777 length:990 start_codon:yes stop_codon:yes gene_type:complete
MKFDIPICIFFFNRPDTTIRVLKQVSKIKPEKLYLLCDGGRNNQESEDVNNCRKSVESAIDWECEVIKKYSNKNIGVYGNIGKGAQWVFSKEDCAIFLEDDNLPENTFFYYCKEMLEKYQYEDKVLWVCGTNYLEKYKPKDGSSYVFTKHLMPCGWASWSNKFNKYYDINLDLARDKKSMSELKNQYLNKSLFYQQRYNFYSTIYKIDSDPTKSSWDHQMSFSIRHHGLYGISPSVNLISNIGVDERSTHGGNSLNKVMTRRFCGIKSSDIDFPLVHPSKITIDLEYEKKVARIILMPLLNRIIIFCIRIIKPLFGIKKYESVYDKFKK